MVLFRRVLRELLVHLVVQVDQILLFQLVLRVVLLVQGNLADLVLLKNRIKVRR